MHIVLLSVVSRGSVEKKIFQEMAYKSFRAWFDGHEPSDLLVQEIPECTDYQLSVIPGKPPKDAA